jgi:hypothetical protein
MVRWYHLVLTAYGFWLPNDPRGSWSQYVGSREIFYHGPATKIADKRSRAHDSHNSYSRTNAKSALKHPPVRFDEISRTAIADGFGFAAVEGTYQILACYIGHDHSHMLIARHERSIERIATHLKSKATMALNRAGQHFTSTPWSEGCWSVFINDEDQLHTPATYINRHPEKENLPLQTWPFISPLPV